MAVFRRRRAAAGELKTSGLRESIMTQPNISPELREELRSTAVEPLLPIEKKLIGWSLTIGLVLLVVLAAVNHFFPTTF
jgi:hypothetical protein